MSYRPTISLYIKRHIADIGYYRNWDDKSLLYEAVTIAMLYGNCKSIEEYRDMRYGHQSVSIQIEPEVWESTEENLLELERCSEFPVIVDVTAKCIYVSDTGALTWKQLSERPSILENRGNYGFHRLMRKAAEYDSLCWSTPDKRPFYEWADEPVVFRRISERSDFGTMMRYCRIPFGHINPEEFIGIISEWKDAGYHLSKDIMNQIKSREEARF